MTDETESPQAADFDAAVPDEQLSHGSGGWLILLVFWSAGIALLTAVMFGSVWLSEQFAILAYREQSPFVGIAVTLIYAVLIALPCLLVARRIGYLRPKAVLRTWAVVGLFALVCLPIRLASISAGQLGAVLQIACAGLFILVARRVLAEPERSQPRQPYWLAIVAAAFVAWPWVIFGAAGSWLDLLLNLVAALVLGAAAAEIFRRELLPHLATTSENVRANIGLGGLAMGTTLMVMGASFGLSGQQLILMLMLPALGWLLMGVAYWGRGLKLATGWASVALAIGLVAFAPMSLVDVDELVLILNLGSRDIAYWVMLATMLSIALALVAGVVVILLAHRLPTVREGKLGPIAAVASVVILLDLFITVGQAGFNGERLFVIMEDQIAWNEVTLPEDYASRREEAYALLVSQADSTQQPIRDKLERLGVDYQPYYLANAMEVDGGPLLKLWLQSQPGVDRVLSSPRLRPLPEPPPIATDTAAAPAEPQWNLTSIGATQVWQNYGVTGEGIIIGQADSGVEVSHPELAGSYRGNQPGDLAGNDYNWFDPWSGAAEPIDYGGHGTHTLGSILGQTVGVAPGATWIACVNLERNLGNPALYLDCLQFLFAPFPLGGDPLHDGRPDLGAHVFNNSWGCPEIEGCDPNALLAAVQALRAAGVFVVASAGNEGPACSTVGAPIALYDEVFSVGATDSEGRIAPFSSRGPVTADGSGRTKPDIAAPGVGVLSSFPGGSYSINSGTSMAGPHVVGSVALLWSADPELIGDIDRTEDLLTSTARPYEFSQFEATLCGTGGVPNNVTGYGLIDIFAAVQAALQPTP